MKPIRASEIGSYLYCRRAWWYRSQGLESENQAELAGGTDYHRQHGLSLLAGRILNLAGWILLLAAVALLAVALTVLVMQ